MALHEGINSHELVSAGVSMRNGLSSSVHLGRASMQVDHKRPDNFLKVSNEMFDLASADPKMMELLKAKGSFQDSSGLWVPDPKSYKTIGDVEEVWNQITNSGRDQLHLQGYGTSGLATNGFNYIALTNTAITPAAGDTALSGEISTNGLGRAQGTYTHNAGTNTTTIDKTFTATGTQSCQAAALFNAASVGVMNHELTFTQRALISGDTIQITYTITLG